MKRAPRLDVSRCPRGHVSLHPGAACPVCGGSVRAVRIRADAVLELVTTVRVNPSGQPFQLGVAVTRAGHARTLCRVEGAVRGLGKDAVVLEQYGEVVVARPRRPFRARSRARVATRRGARRY